MVLAAPGERLRLEEVPDPVPADDEVLIEVSACAVCRTDLHIVDGELGGAKLPLIPGHQIVGTVVDTGERVGVPWLGRTCSECRFCRSGRENLCDAPVFTGHGHDGGYAELATAARAFTFPLPDGFADLQAAPLLCAGLIGHRALRMTGDAERLGLYGFGAAAHIVCQVARWEGRRVSVFTRSAEARRLATSLGALAEPDEEFDAAIIFAPAGELVPAALRALAKGGVVVCAGIHMSDIPELPYELLWGERTLRSVANLTRQDGEEFLALAPRVPVRTEVTAYPLESANDALDDLRAGRITGAGVLSPS